MGRLLWNIFIFIHKRLGIIILFCTNFMINIINYIIVTKVNLFVKLAHILFVTISKTIDSTQILDLLASNLQNLLRDKNVNFILNFFCLYDCLFRQRWVTRSRDYSILQKFIFYIFQLRYGIFFILYFCNLIQVLLLRWVYIRQLILLN